MSGWSITIACVVGAFLIGSIPFGYLTAKLHGVDIRSVGSGNIGATNVFRIIGRTAGVTVFFLDLFKGLIAVLLTRQFAHLHPSLEPYLPLICGVAAILGHNFTPWLGFRGGKGIATSAGVIVALIPVAFLTGLVIWTLTFFSTRYVAVASIVAAITIPATVIIQHALGHFDDPNQGMSFVLFALLLGGLAIWRHRSNIHRLRTGTENRFEFGKSKKK